MKFTPVKKLNPFEKYIDQIIRMMKSSKVAPWKKSWVGKETGRFPANPVTDRPYTGMNRFCLSMVRYCAGYSTNYWA